MRGRFWNARRKWMGNLAPASIWLPLTAAGVIVIMRPVRWAAVGLWLLASGQVLAWLALNFVGLYENRAMRAALEREFLILKPGFRGWRLFAGYASEGYSSVLDPHEDLGYLLLTPDGIEFIGDSRRLVIRRNQVLRIFRKPNVHTFVGLGGWVCVEALEAGHPRVHRFEPRQRDSLLGNFLLLGGLKRRLTNWLKRDGPQSR
ncbi:MAG: hypothetical protein HYR64_01710 [Fimbriimonas ginsengisoli]|uniref:Uncharacterized protein n=1 Tax=Fimbriimonas ginsengisoli TaxID=1005039 RepID=A0A931LTE7_FIMGI|nr:hypothetical protein [Fimbriimonas ginsengisoli]